jgi:hypothetical protein
MLLAPKKSATHKYKLELVKRIAVKEITFAGITQADAEKRFLTGVENAYSYQVEISNHLQKSNLKGDSWKRDIAPLRFGLDLSTDLHGRIKDICNFEQVNEKWQEIRKNLIRKKAEEPDSELMITQMDKIIKDKNLFVELLNTEGIYDLLFPLVYGNYKDKMVFNKIVPNVFNDYGLPLKITRKMMINEQQKKEVKFQGELDTANFDHSRVSNFFKRLFDKYDLMASEVNVDFYSSYELNDDHHIQYGGQYLFVEIPGVFTQEQTGSLTLNN